MKWSRNHSRRLQRTSQKLESQQLKQHSRKKNIQIDRKRRTTWKLRRTRIGNITSTVIDFAIMKNWNNVITMYTKDALKSDNNPVIMEIEIKTIIRTINSRKLNENNMTWKKYHKKLESVKLAKIETAHQVDERVEKITKVIREATMNAKKQWEKQQNSITLPQEIIHEI